MRNLKLLFLLLAISCSKRDGDIALDDVKWIHGSADCKSNIDQPIQVVRYNTSTWILRQNKCLNYEAPFLFLLMGESKALLIDTGATKDTLSFPLYHVVDSLLHKFYGTDFSKAELVVAHTHSHGDHHAADIQFKNKSNTKVVGLDVADVQSFFNITNWPDQFQEYNLGNRIIDLIPIPGHQRASIAFYDRETEFLFSGDTFYPGRLYVEDWQAFTKSIQRLVDFTKNHSVRNFIGNHIEMTRTPGKDYPTGTIYQPEEHPLLLTSKDIQVLNDSLRKTGDLVRRIVCNDFIVFPTYESLPRESNIENSAIATLNLEGYPDFMKSEDNGVWVTNEGRIEKLEFGKLKPVFSVSIPQPCGVMATGFSSLWVANCKDESVYRIDLKTGKILVVIKTGLADKDGELSIAASDDGIWLLTKEEGELSKIDPRTNRVTLHIKVEPNSYAVAFGFGALWITNTKNNSVQQVDLKKNSVVASIKVGKEPRFLAVGRNGIWTLNQEDGTVSKIDPVTKEVKTIDVDVEGSGGDIAVGDKYVYVRAKKTLLSVIDPERGKVTARYGPIAGSGAVAVEHGHVWVTAHDINKVWVLKE